MLVFTNHLFLVHVMMSRRTSSSSSSQYHASHRLLLLLSSSIGCTSVSTKHSLLCDRLHFRVENNSNKRAIAAGCISVMSGSKKKLVSAIPAGLKCETRN